MPNENSDLLKALLGSSGVPYPEQIAMNDQPADLQQAVGDLESQIPKQPEPIPQMPPLPEQNPPTPEPIPVPFDASKFQDKEMEDAINKRNEMNKLSLLLEGANQIGTAMATGGKHSAKELGTSDFSSLQKLGQSGVEGISDKRKSQDYTIKRQQELKDLQSAAEQNDPNSRRSQLSRDLFSKASGIPVEQLSKMSEAEITRNFPFMDKIVQRQVDREKESRLAEQNKLERDYKERELSIKSDQAKADLASKREIAKQASEDRRLAQQQSNELKQLLVGHKLESEEDMKKERADKAARLSDKQVESLSNNAKALSALDNIMEQKKKWDTGPISMGQNKLASMVGLDDPEKSAFKSDVGEELATYIKGISGATVSPTERAALLANVPSVYDNDKTFEAKAQALKKRLTNLNSVETQYLKKQGKNTSEFESDSGNRSTAGKEQPRSDMVKMRTPDGVLHSVPSNKVEEAKKRGAKLE